MALIGALILLTIPTMSYPTAAGLLLMAVIALTGLLLGWGGWTFVRRHYLTVPQMQGGYMALALGALLLAGFAAWYIWPGTPASKLPTPR